MNIDSHQGVCNLFVLPQHLDLPPAHSLCTKRNRVISGSFGGRIKNCCSSETLRFNAASLLCPQVPSMLLLTKVNNRICVKSSPSKFYFTSFRQSCMARNKAKTSYIPDITACFQLPKRILSSPSNLSIMDFFFFMSSQKEYIFQSILPLIIQRKWTNRHTKAI